jgi:site-specific DNA-methyltransferase (adenine-specific)
MDSLIEKNVTVDSIITDPPYGISRKNNLHTVRGRADIDFGEWDNNFDQMKWIKRIPKLLSKNATVVIF